MKRFVWLLILVCLAAAALYLAPQQIERGRNVVVAHRPYPVAEAAAKLHRTLQVADLHADSLLWSRDLLSRGNRGQVDVPRLIEGNVAIQVFTTVTKTPHGQNYLENTATAPDDLTALAIVQRWPFRTWFSHTERALYQASKLQLMAIQAPDRLARILDQEDLKELLARRAAGEMVVGAIMGTEGSHALDGDLVNIDRLYRAGFRLMGLHHFFDNELGGSLHGESRGGLTEFGKSAVVAMQKQGIIIDVAHSSPAAVADVLKLGTKPIIVSHTGIRSYCPTRRNIPDALLREIAQRGGLIGIGFWDEAVCDATPAGVAMAIQYAITLLGEDAVALGSDFDGAVTTYFDSSELAALTQALLDRGLSELQIRKVMGGNVIRFLEHELPRAS